MEHHLPPLGRVRRPLVPPPVAGHLHVAGEVKFGDCVEILEWQVGCDQQQYHVKVEIVFGVLKCYVILKEVSL